MKLYKIRNKETGLYSNGGSYTHWTKNGKVWKQLNHLSSHLNYHLNDNYYANAEIVEIEYDETNVFCYDVKELINSKIKKQKEVERKYIESREKYEKERELKLLRDLKNKYEV